MITSEFHELLKSNWLFLNGPHQNNNKKKTATTTTTLGQQNQQQIHTCKHYMYLWVWKCSSTMRYDSGYQRQRIIDCFRFCFRLLNIVPIRITASFRINYCVYVSASDIDGQRSSYSICMYVWNGITARSNLKNDVGLSFSFSCDLIV